MYEKNVKGLIEESMKLIGREAEEVMPANDSVDAYAIDDFCRATGEANPLFTNPAHATNTKYGCLIAPPTFLAAIRYPAAEGAYAKADFGLARALTGVDFEWFDAIRCGDKAQTSLKLIDASEGKGWKGRPTAVLKSEAVYRNRYGGLLAKATGTMTFTPLERGKEMIIDRPMYRHSKEDVKRIEAGINGEVIRGSKPLYWEEVKVGDELAPVVKGAVDQTDLIMWQEATAPFLRVTELAMKEAMDMPGKRRINPATGWPYYNADQEPDDFVAAPLNGISLPYVREIEMACLTGNLLTNWMGDEGFLKRLEVNVHQPLLYGDAAWYKGNVVDKYKVKMGDTIYRAVDVAVTAMNQLGETNVSGSATILLPSPGHQVVLPIPKT